MGRYSTLYRLPGSLYEDGSPLLVSAGALLKDDQIGRVLVQLKFRSLSNKEIKAVIVSVTAYDVSGDVVDGVEGFQYLDLNVRRGEEFGDRRAIPMPNPVARSFDVCVDSVLFSDGTAWNASSTAPWKVLPHILPLSEAIESPELLKQYVRDTSEKSRFAPFETADLWYCACGSINKNSEEDCPCCGVERELIFEALDEKQLENNFKKWMAQQEMDYSAEQVHSKKKKSTFMKVLLILLPILIIIAAGIFAATQYLLPMMAYKRADEKLALHDFDGAIADFTALGDYQDSADKVLQARYGAALEMLEKGSFEQARVEFILLGDYQDSADKVNECDYVAAEKLLSAHEYDAAKEAFLALGDYRDSADRALEAQYEKASSFAEAGDDDAAIELFTELGSYADAEARVSEIRQAQVDRVNRLIRQNKFEEAWAEYEKLNNYSPEPLSAADFVLADDGDMCEYLDENTTGDKNFGVYRYLANGYESRKDIVVTAREVRLTDDRLAVLMAYGQPDEEGVLITDGGFYTQLDEESQAAMLEECDHYIRYSYNNYRMYFYFDAEDKLTWLIFSNEDYFCSTPDAVGEAAEEAAE